MSEARNLEFAEMVGGARAIIKAIPQSRGPATVVAFPLTIAPLLRPIRDMGGQILRDMQAVLDLPDEQQTDELLSVTLVRATWVVDSVGAVIDSGAKAFEIGALLANDWPPELVSEIVRLVEDFEDVQESIGLALSEEFKKDLESARVEAQR